MSGEPPRSPVIVARGLRKYFGRVQALSGVSFTVVEGEIYGLVGPNGAGKTTTLRIVAGIYRPDGGEIRVLGRDPASMGRSERSMIAYLPEEGQPYRNLTGREFLELYATIYGVEDVDSYVEEAAELSGLGSKIDEKTMGYSKGMKRRLLVAAILALKPKIAILDEPTSGLDPLYSVTLREIIIEYNRRYGVTVLLSSHNMFEVEYLCDRVAVISRGRTVFEGTPRDAVEKTGSSNLEEAFLKLSG
jgi:ABC-2 type transport system ATP-binding protein